MPQRGHCLYEVLPYVEVLQLYNFTIYFLNSLRKSFEVCKYFSNCTGA